MGEGKITGCCCYWCCCCHCGIVLSISWLHFCFFILSNITCLALNPLSLPFWGLEMIASQTSDPRNQSQRHVTSFFVFSYICIQLCIKHICQYTGVPKWVLFHKSSIIKFWKYIYTVILFCFFTRHTCQTVPSLIVNAQRFAQCTHACVHNHVGPVHICVSVRWGE